jgi:L-ascorbate metabolism protein UlaG (beta-lactamase superfamily)
MGTLLGERPLSFYSVQAPALPLPFPRYILLPGGAKMKNTAAAAALSLGLMAAPASAGPGTFPVLTFYGRASVKIRTTEGIVVYIDPYKGDYSEPADLVLVTHGHDDHNAVAKVTKKPGCVVAAPAGAVPSTSTAVVEGKELEVAGLRVLPVAAYNKNHKRGESVGYVLTIGSLVLYHSGDTSSIPEMSALAGRGIGWALLCTDGYWNMGPEEAAGCAKTIGARHSVPIHSSPNGLAQESNARAFAKAAPGGLVIEVGGSVSLEP